MSTSRCQADDFGSSLMRSSRLAEVWVMRPQGLAERAGRWKPIVKAGGEEEAKSAGTLPPGRIWILKAEMMTNTIMAGAAGCVVGKPSQPVGWMTRCCSCGPAISGGDPGRDRRH